MALDPAPGDVVLLHQRVQRHPEVRVLDLFFVRGAPGPLLPAVDPFGHTFHDILGINVQNDLAGAFERTQRLDDRHHFHAVVGGQRLTTVERFLDLATLEQHAPATHPGIAFAGTVRPDFDAFFTICLRTKQISHIFCVQS